MVNNQGDHEKTDVASDQSGSRTGAVELLVRSGHVVKTSALYYYLPPGVSTACVELLSSLPVTNLLCNINSALSTPMFV